jgi:hypothetical protein
MFNLTPQVRKAIYIVVAALLSVLVAFNLVDSAQVPDILNVLGGLLGVSASALAAPNVPKE